MTAAILDHSPVAATNDDRQRISELAALLDSLAAERPERRPRLVAPNSGEIELPEPVFHLLRQAVYYLAQGDSVALVARHQELTTQQAADLLNISRPYLVRLLEQGEIPFTKTGRHRRVRVGDLLAYKDQRDSRRHRALDRLTRLSQEAGLYSTSSQSK